MNKIEKFLNRLSPDKRIEIENLVKQISSGNWLGLNVVKLKGKKDLFRVRTGNIRVIFIKDDDEPIVIIKIQYRNENTYKF